MQLSLVCGGPVNDTHVPYLATPGRLALGRLGGVLDLNTVPWGGTADFNLLSQWHIRGGELMKLVN